MTREIPLTRGLVALVDDEDYDRLSKFKWRATPNGPNSKTFYAVTGQRGAATMMHNMVLPVSSGFEVDHRDRNGLNNTRANLRQATRAQQVQNRSYSRPRAGYRGAYPKGSKWRACIMVDRRQVALGCFATEIEAARAYDKAAIEIAGEFAVLNFASHRDWLFPFETSAAAGPSEDRGPGREAGAVGAEKARRLA